MRKQRLFSVFWALSAMLTAAAHADHALNVDSRVELFVDEFLIERLERVDLRLHPPVVRETVFQFDAPWEGSTSTYVTVFEDDGRYRMYYRGSKGDDLPVTCTAESPEGVRWARPVVGLHEYGGSKNNNIVLASQGADNFAPFKDSNPDAKPDEKYKAIARERLGGAPKGLKGIFVFASGNGYAWKRLRNKPVITDGDFDSQNLAFWDSERKEYVCYVRDRRDGARTIKRTTSKDFINWSAPEWLQFPGAPDEHLYTNAIIPYYRAPHIYLGFPERFVPERKALATNPKQGVSDGLFMTSRDGLTFRRWREAFMRPGRARENWGHGSVMAAWGMLELQPGEMSIYYAQCYDHPTSCIARATLRTDGFVSAHADADGGGIRTKPLIFKGKEMVINYSTSAAGHVQVEIQDANGNPIAGFGMEECPVIYGDEIERVVQWNAGRDVSTLAGKTVRLKFGLRDADLYSFRFRE